jgi:uncharacterized protein YjbI with pentapeptide repeats
MSELLRANLDSICNLLFSNLSNACLDNASLHTANLYETTLNETSFVNSNLRWAIGNGEELKSMQWEEYCVVYCPSTNVMAIGCQQHSVEDWYNFTDIEIEDMETGAIYWWRKYKPILTTLGIFNDRI